MTYYDFLTVQGKDKVRLPIAGLRTQLFHLIFTEPGNSTLAHPCINRNLTNSESISSSPLIYDNPRVTQKT